MTNLHVWMLTVRLRALPGPHGKHYIQALIDHFFYDVEDRIRAVLQPTVRPQPRLPPPAVGARASSSGDTTSALRRKNSGLAPHCHSINTIPRIAKKIPITSGGPMPNHEPV